MSAEVELRGRVIREELGPGHFLLETSDGRRFALQGGDEGLFVEGAEVWVEGALRDDLLGVGMTAERVLSVARYGKV
ncbi:MAG: DUF5818 domain-containing protein [Planctomycetota bacterium]